MTDETMHVSRMLEKHCNNVILPFYGCNNDQNNDVK